MRHRWKDIEQKGTTVHSVCRVCGCDRLIERDSRTGYHYVSYRKKHEDDYVRSIPECIDPIVPLLFFEQRNQDGIVIHIPNI